MATTELGFFLFDVPDMDGFTWCATVTMAVLYLQHEHHSCPSFTCHCWGKLVNYCSYTGIVTLALIIFENICFLKLWKRNLIMRDSCGSSGTKSLHLVFSLRESMNEGDIPHPNVCYQLATFTWIFLAVSSIARMGILIQQAAEPLGDSLTPPQSCTRMI